MTELALRLPRAGASGIGRAIRALREADKLLLVSAFVCGLIVLIAIIGPWIAPHSANEGEVLSANLEPSGAHPFGTDSLGRDILSRVLVGARLSLIGPALVILACTVLGTTLAIGSAWFGGSVDKTVARVLDVLFAFPALLFAILAVAVLGEGFWAPVAALSIAYTPYMARIVRSLAVRERNLPYVEACRLSGFSAWRICAAHLLPNVWPIILAQATIGFGGALVDLAAISFLGLGVQPPSNEWGLMVADGRTALLNGWPQEALAAGAMIVITVVAFNVLGERLAAREEP